MKIIVVLTFAMFPLLTFADGARMTVSTNLPIPIEVIDAKSFTNTVNGLGCDMPGATKWTLMFNNDGTKLAKNVQTNTELWGFFTIPYEIVEVDSPPWSASIACLDDSLNMVGGGNNPSLYVEFSDKGLFSIFGFSQITGSIVLNVLGYSSVIYIMLLIFRTLLRKVKNSLL